MFCAHCGKEIPENSKFCCYCGQSAVPQPDVPVVESTAPQPDAVVTDPPTPHPPVEDHPSRPKKHLWILLAVAAVACGALIFHATTAGSIQSAIATSSGSEYKNRMVELRPEIAYHSEQMVSKALSNPANAKFTHNWDAFSNDGIILTDCGTVTYNDSENKEKTQDFAATMALNQQHKAYYLMLKLDREILYNLYYAVDSNGTIVANDIQFGGRGCGEQIFDDPINPDKWAKNAADFNNAEDEITLAEFTALDLDITYKEACAVIGSSGAETSRINVLGSETVIYTWKGIGAKGASATLTFVNDVLIAKEQTGLK